MIADPGANPEEQVLQAEEEGTRAALLAAVKAAAAELPADDRLYLQIVFLLRPIRYQRVK